MKIRNILVVLLISSCWANIATGQFYYYNSNYYETNVVYEFGASVGVMNSITDVGGASTENGYYFNEIHPKNTNFSPGIYAGALFKNMLGVRLEATLGQVEGADSSNTGQTNNLKSIRRRNLSFKSKIAEVALLAEFHPLSFINFEIIPFLSPYVLAGVGWYSFNPQAQYKGQWIDLQPLRTEGQGFDEYPDRKPYSLSSYNIPLGVGLRYEVSNRLNLRLEFLHRVLFTDYLDDASTKKYIDPALFAKYLSPADAANARALYNRTKDGSIPIFRGHENRKDAYMSASLKIGVSFGRDRATGPGAGRNQLKCRL